MLEVNEGRKRHCWECLRRCLVCDSTKPACKRCSASDIVCPGYSDVKPTRLRWLEPGKVKVRPKSLKALKSSKASKDNDPEKTGIKAATGSIFDYAIILPVEVFTEPGALNNTYIYHDLVPINQLGQNPHIFRISPALLQEAMTSPHYLQSGMVCMTLSHRMNRSRDHPELKALAQKFYMYRGNAIRSLTEEFNVEDKCAADSVIAGALTLLLIDAQHGTLTWRCHLEGINKMIKLRGGYPKLVRSKSLKPMLITIWFVKVFGNTTCPVSSLAWTESHLDAVDFILDQYSAAISPFHLCPLPLVIEIIKINHLRMRGWKHVPSESEDLSQEANEILRRVHDFSPEQWATSKPLSTKEWVLIGTTYQIAVGLFCIHSLQSVSILLEMPSLRLLCTTYGQHLQELLKEALSSQHIKRFMIWPLILLGVEAVHGIAEMRAFVTTQLKKLSYDVGTYGPLTANSVLESFWASGKTLWDDCFDQPYAFTTQIAVDTSQIITGLSDTT
ncbi:hypothetical protein BELL_1380g00030 [Botrytis elliptica]|uniref:Zn(2)-C6 fungal-type domain-containing protein n=1 Tax=Botrytis elliptica TaxID=278938 RepID=A0A4Z1I5N3_9HELO|nr:hypothetical protein BELL_1380g00030 [Botrytis elliptica]